MNKLNNLQETISWKYITKYISQKEWKEYYSQDISYALIRQSGRGVIIGFLVIGDEIPVGCQLALPEEEAAIRRHRENYNIYPR